MRPRPADHQNLPHWSSMQLICDDLSGAYVDFHNPLTKLPCPSHVCVCVKGSVTMQCCNNGDVQLCVCVCVCVCLWETERERERERASTCCVRAPAVTGWPMGLCMTVVEILHLWTDFLNSLVEWTNREQDHSASTALPTLCVNSGCVQCVCLGVCVYLCLFGPLPGQADCKRLVSLPGVLFYLTWHLLAPCTLHLGPALLHPSLSSTTCLNPPSSPIQHTLSEPERRLFRAEEFIIIYSDYTWVVRSSIHKRYERLPSSGFPSAEVCLTHSFVLSFISKLTCTKWQCCKEDLSGLMFTILI